MVSKKNNKNMLAYARVSKKKNQKKAELRPVQPKNQPKQVSLTLVSQNRLAFVLVRQKRTRKS